MTQNETYTYEPVLFVPIDLCECYEPDFIVPEDFMEEYEKSMAWKYEPTLENTSHYVTEPDGTKYFYCGNTRIKVTEHFSDNGKSMEALMEDVIQFAGNQNRGQEKDASCKMFVGSSVTEPPTQGSRIFDQRRNALAPGPARAAG